MNARLLRGSLLLAALTFIFTIQAHHPLVFATPGAPASLTRTLDPVVLSGEQAPAWQGVALDQLFLYAYHPGGGWEQIPWQFDEKRDGVYVSNEDGRLDGDDELAFMARDCGDQAPPSQWIGDADARNHRRYEITVTNPLHAGERCWVYLYRSSTLDRAEIDDYVDYAAHVATSDQYRLTLQQANLIAEGLQLFGNQTDVLDRTKVRIQLGSTVINEEQLAPADPRTDWYGIRDGHVRTITHFIGYDPDTDIRYLSLVLVNYRNTFHERITLDLSSVNPTLDAFRYSADLTQAMAGGTYYDANTPAGVPVDGHPDAVATTPFSPWNQVSHPTLGSIVQVIDPSPLGGTLQTYYKDDSSYDSNDTGDHQSYADPGVLVTNGSADLVFDVWYYVLPAGQPNVGTAYAEAAMHPLQTQATAQEHVEATATPELLDLYLPLIQAE